MKPPHKVGDVIRVVEKVAPPSLAESWDNPGLQVGSPDWPVAKIWVALDPTPEVVSEAGKAGVDLLITHHPLLFKPVKSINSSDPLGSVIYTAFQHRLAIFTAHTNLDAVNDGVNDALATKIGLRDLAVLSTSSECAGSQNAGDGDDVVGRTNRPKPCGLGRIGSLAQTTGLYALAQNIKQLFKIPYVTVAGEPDLAIHEVAVCSGSGAGLLGDFLTSQAEVFVSGDLRYHDARAVEQCGKGLIDMGHFASEFFIVEALAVRLTTLLEALGMHIVVEPCRLEKDPFVAL